MLSATDRQYNRDPNVFGRLACFVAH